MDYMSDFMEAKYHLAVAERMIHGYEKYPEKRFLIGVINEGARAVSLLIRAFLVKDMAYGDINVFVKKIGPKYLNGVTVENLLKILEVERAQKSSPIEFTKRDKIILLVRGKYFILTVYRLTEFVKSIRLAISEFSASIKR